MLGCWDVQGGGAGLHQGVQGMVHRGQQPPASSCPCRSLQRVLGHIVHGAHWQHPAERQGTDRHPSEAAGIPGRQTHLSVLATASCPRSAPQQRFLLLVQAEPGTQVEPPHRWVWR